MTRLLLPSRITVKFSLTIALLLAILLFEAVIGHSALTVVWESNNEILANDEMQRLAMGMSQNWEAVKRLRRSFFSQTPHIGYEDAYDFYALPAGGKITEVIRDGATLTRQATSLDTGAGSPESITDLQNYLARVSQYADTFEETTDLEMQLSKRDTGLASQLERAATELLDSLQTADDPAEMLAVYFEMRYLERDIFDPARLSIGENMFAAATRLRRSIEGSTLPPADMVQALALLDEYRQTADEIVVVIARREEKVTRLNLLDQSIEPILIELLASIETQVGLERVQIEETRRNTLEVLAVAAVSGLFAAGTIAVAFHLTVTRKIVKLIRVARRLHEGDLQARADITSEDELGELASTLNKMAGSVQRLTGELREQATRDALTGLFNRRYLDETLSRELARSFRSGKPISLVMIDMDHLKEINDAHGHARGDQMLVQLGKILKSQSRGGDIACRFGGDEFVILMPGVTLDVGLQRARQWKRQFEEAGAMIGGNAVEGSLSAGVAEWRSGESPEQLISRADAALYKAKESGRSLVEQAI